jgi:predicted enzyme related to lactoylglutathione lyase
LLANIDVDDLDRATAFYVTGLDLSIGRRFGASAIELVGAGAPIYLLSKAAGTHPIPGRPHSRDYARHWTPVHLDFVVEDVSAARARAIAAGATSEGGIETHAWGTIAHLADPFGNGFCLLQFSVAGYDAIAT